MPTSSSVLKTADDAKAMQIDVEDLTKTIEIEADLNPK
jgi:hypothetical protein